MGVNLILIAGHRMSPGDVERLAPRLNETPRAFECLSEFLEAAGWEIDSKWHWQNELYPCYSTFVDQWQAECELNIVQCTERGKLESFPHIDVHERAIVLDAGKTWHHFCDPEGGKWREMFRAAGRELAAIGGMGRVIYVPDSAYPASTGWDVAMDGASLDEVERLLRNHCGGPVNLNEIADDNVELSFESWFVD